MFSKICKSFCRYQNAYIPKRIILKSVRRQFSNERAPIVLGIETSCDDTGCAIVDSTGVILGEALDSQHLIHLRNGGIIPPIAQDLHRSNIEKVVNSAVASAGIDFREIDAIAVTVKPGLPLSLSIGMKYGKYLCRTYKKPFIPIHHMEAHALTARMYHPKLEFPFLVLLISGGHCLLAVARGVDDFLLMGETLNDAPGEAYDKMARRLRLTNNVEFAKCSSGRAIEIAASRADNPLQFKLTPSLLKYQDCNFSFAGIKNQLQCEIVKEERDFNVPPDAIIPNVNNLCAAFQLVVTKHLCHRVQRGMEYVKLRELVPEDKRALVVSGGVACNDFIAKGLKLVCDELGYHLIRPPPTLCTDNGVMIAWNGIERLKIGKGIVEDLESIRTQKSCPLGESIISDVEQAKIRPKWVKLRTIFD